MLEGIKNKKWMYLSAFLLAAALFVFFPVATDAGKHCPQAEAQANAEKEAKERGEKDKEHIDVLCLENDYPEIPLSKIPGVGVTFEKGAYSLNDIAAKLAPFNTIDPLGGLIYYFFVLSISMVGIVAFGVLIYTGVMFMMSGARPQLRMEAKSRLRNVVLGIALLLGSVLLLNTINPELSIIKVPGAEKKKDFAFPLPSASEIQKRKQIADAAKGMCTGSNRFEDTVQGAPSTLLGVAEHLCNSKNVTPSDREIHTLLTTIVGTDNCSQDDVTEIQQIIKDEELCGTGDPSPTVSVGGGEVAINSDTVPETFCTYTAGALDPVGGEVFNDLEGIPGVQSLETINIDYCNKPAEVIETLKGNVAAIVTYCASDVATDKPLENLFCFLNDFMTTPISGFTEQKQQDELSRYCLDILPSCF